MDTTPVPVEPTTAEVGLVALLARAGRISRRLTSVQFTLEIVLAHRLA